MERILLAPRLLHGCSRWKPFWLLILSILLSPPCYAVEIPIGWQQRFDTKRNAQLFQPIEPVSNILIKYYPKEPLHGSGIHNWLRNKLSSSKAPRGKWQGQADIVRDSANYAHGKRAFQRADGGAGLLEAVAVTVDRENARLAIMIHDKQSEGKELLKQAYQILTNIYQAEKADALNEGRNRDIETRPPEIEGMKLGGPIKPGRYVGSKTRDQEVKWHVEVILYETGEFEFLRGYDKSGSYLYSQALGRLNMVEDFYNSSYQPNRNFCVYGVHQQSGKQMIYAREDNNLYRLRWENAVDRLSPRQRKQLDEVESRNTRGYKYIAEKGEGISTDQIETILYTYKDTYQIGGMETDEAIYLLMKDGRVRDGLPIPPSRMDVAKSRSREPGRWGWWKYQEDRYSFSWNIERKHYKVPEGKQIKTVPIPKGTRLTGDWGASSSFVSLDFSDISFWGVILNKDGRFKRYHRNTKQAGASVGSPFGFGDLVTAYNSDEYSAVTVVGERVGGGSSTRRKTDKNRIGSYEFDGYTLILKYDSGVVKYLPTFATSDKFRGIWFEGGYLHKTD